MVWLRSVHMQVRIWHNEASSHYACMPVTSSALLQCSSQGSRSRCALFLRLPTTLQKTGMLRQQDVMTAAAVDTPADGDGHDQSSTGDCSEACCNGEHGRKPYQPKEEAIFSGFVRNGHRFLPLWYLKYNWISLCTTRKRVFCLYCQFVQANRRMTFSTKADQAFSEKGFDNYKKAIEKFSVHDKSSSHNEAMLKWHALAGPPVNEQLDSQSANAQATHRAGLLKQLEGMLFLLRQGLALRGHTEAEGNLPQLLAAWGHGCQVIRTWLKENKYMLHDIVSEIICIMGQKVLRRVIGRIKQNERNWYALIADEATDVACNTQLNLSVRYVDDEYVVHEDCVGLVCLPNGSAETIAAVIKDVLSDALFPYPCAEVRHMMVLQ